MRNRKRRAVQPMLESMEHRVVPSSMGAAAHEVRVVASQVDRVNKPVQHAKVDAHTMNAGLRKLQQQLELIQTRSMERTPSAQETPAEKATTETSSLFKSIFASL